MRFGSLTALMITEARWVGTVEEDYPPSQGWADDIEAVLGFLDGGGQLKRFWPRLTGPTVKGRDNALAEGRAAYWFGREGFSFADWEPNLTGCPGEFSVQRSDVGSIFVEVKQPGWDGELTRNEQLSGRQRQYRYRNGEARSIDPGRTVLQATRSAVRKMMLDRPSLAVIDCSRMFQTPLFLATVDDYAEDLRKPAFIGIGGLLLLDPCMPGEVVRYDTFFVENPNAVGEPWALPADLVAEWMERNKPERRRR